MDAPPGVEVLRYDAAGPGGRRATGLPPTLLRLHYADWLRAHAPQAVLVLSPVEARGVAARYAGGGPPTLAVFYDLIPLLFADEYLHRQPDRVGVPRRHATAGRRRATGCWPSPRPPAAT